MNQTETNNIARLFIHEQTIEATEKLAETLLEDIDERGKRVPGQALHHIHNLAMFECLVWMNSPALNNRSEQERQNFRTLTAELKGRFLDMVEEIKDFHIDPEKTV